MQLRSRREQSARSCPDTRGFHRRIVSNRFNHVPARLDRPQRAVIDMSVGREGLLSDMHQPHSLLPQALDGGAVVLALVDGLRIRRRGSAHTATDTPINTYYYTTDMQVNTFSTELPAYANQHIYYYTSSICQPVYHYTTDMPTNTYTTILPICQSTHIQHIYYQYMSTHILLVCQLLKCPVQKHSRQIV
jgi:hypothetical protein